jgi:hypothetical protein
VAASGAGSLLPTRAGRRIGLDIVGDVLDLAILPERASNEGPLVIPTRELLCTCLEVFAIAHVEWGSVVGSREQWLKPRIDGIEIVDLQPSAMESAIECYLIMMLRLGILPRLIVPMEKLILDVTAELRKQGLEVDEQIDLMPAAVPGEVPNNPAIEQDQLKAFIKLMVTSGSA